ncbi:hypothetical protein CYY_009341 [Polysphondylium violaceum]|uniref:Ankyrin repeat-containing protein n=1 Tax=Polysphondylium violaceum TaxID=133409 RepID=A0A8J4PKB4_9MYCE|nr:hypothetical protein CYY_009341 [Polysphondylium violaceum]
MVKDHLTVDCLKLALQANAELKVIQFLVTNFPTPNAQYVFEIWKSCLIGGSVENFIYIKRTIHQREYVYIYSQFMEEAIDMERWEMVELLLRQDSNPRSQYDATRLPLHVIKNEIERHREQCFSTQALNKSLAGSFQSPDPKPKLVVPRLPPKYLDTVPLLLSSQLPFTEFLELDFRKGAKLGYVPLLRFMAILSKPSRNDWDLSKNRETIDFFLTFFPEIDWDFNGLAVNNGDLELVRYVFLEKNICNINSEIYNSNHQVLDFLRDQQVLYGIEFKDSLITNSFHGDYRILEIVYQTCNQPFISQQLFDKCVKDNRVDLVRYMLLNPNMLISIENTNYSFSKIDLKTSSEMIQLLFDFSNKQQLKQVFDSFKNSQIVLLIMGGHYQIVQLLFTLDPQNLGVYLRGINSPIPLKMCKFLLGFPQQEIYQYIEYAVNRSYYKLLQFIYSTYSDLNYWMLDNPIFNQRSLLEIINSSTKIKDLINHWETYGSLLSLKYYISTQLYEIDQQIALLNYIFRQLSLKKIVKLFPEISSFNVPIFKEFQLFIIKQNLISNFELKSIKKSDILVLKPTIDIFIKEYNK